MADESIYIYENENIIWALPGLFQYEAVLGTFQDYCKMLGFKPFNVDFYGAPATIWNGGRKPVIYDKLTPKEISKVFEYVKSNNATPVLTFNNTEITNESLDDEYANLILDIALEYNAKFMVYSDLLRDYIKNKKQDAIVIASVIKPVVYFQGQDRIDEPTIEKESEFYNKLLKEYDIVALRAEYSKFALVNNTSLIDDISRVQVLINQTCLQNCAYAVEHIKFNEKFNTSQELNYDFICPKKTLSANIRYMNNAAHTQKEIQTLIDAGVRNLKLKGRGGSCEPMLLLRIFQTLLCRTDGANYHVITSYPEAHMDMETDYFAKFIGRS